MYRDIMRKNKSWKIGIVCVVQYIELALPSNMCYFIWNENKSWEGHTHKGSRVD